MRQDYLLVKLIRKYSLYLLLAWTAIVLTSFFLITYFYHKATIDSASEEARAHYKLNILYRVVISRMGGLYASTKHIAPNPYLNVPDREILASNGDELTLVNPAYLTRIVFEAFREADEFPVINKITSLKPLNPANKPDEWEKEALLSFEKGIPESKEITQIDGAPYLRLIRPFVTEKNCLKCHGHQGYKVGDIRGGISIAVPLRPYYATERHTVRNIVMVYLLLWSTVSGVLIALARIAARKAIDYEETRAMSLHDPLTGLANRRYMEIDLRETFGMAKRYGTIFSVLMADIDHFKAYNDKHGHRAGDLLLYKIANLILQEIRGTDLAARYGGEEFLVIAHQTGAQEAFALAERIRRRVSGETNLTLSIGIASYEEQMQNEEEILNYADQAMYRVKQSGRNHVELYRPSRR